MENPVKFLPAEWQVITVRIGGVVAGDVPAVTNSGIGKDVILNFTLPRGLPGTNGVCTIVTLSADDYAALTGPEQTNGTWYVIPRVP